MHERPTPPTQETVHPVYDVELRNGESARIDKPIYGSEFVKQATGIRDHEYLGQVSVPTRTEDENTVMETFHMFRTVSHHAAPLELSRNTSSELLDHVTPLNTRG